MKRCQKVLQRTSVGDYFGKTSVGRNIGRIISKKVKLGHIVPLDRYFSIFFQIRGKVFGRTSVGANLRRTSVGRNFKSTLAKKTIFKSVKNLEDD